MAIPDNTETIDKAIDIWFREMIDIRLARMNHEILFGFGHKCPICSAKPRSIMFIMEELEADGKGT